MRQAVNFARLCAAFCAVATASAAAVLAGEPPAESHREVRAIWCGAGVGLFPGDWERTAKLAADNGYNMILPNMAWAGVADYPSDVLPRSLHCRQYGDQLKQCCAAAKRHGLEVHVWKINFYLGGEDTDFARRLRHAGRLQLNAKGRPIAWLCPSHPANRKLELDAMLEIAQKYPVDGLHFDYIRYPDPDACYCQGCRQRFEAQSGRRVFKWPDDCYTGARTEEYTQWRCQQITALVAAVSRQVKRVRPTIKISAAVFPSYPRCRQRKFQEWPVWVRAGYLDFICPMDYTDSNEEFSGWVRDQVKLVAGRIPIYPGIGLWKLTPEQFAAQIGAARSRNTPGFAVFSLSPTTIGSMRVIGDTSTTPSR